MTDGWWERRRARARWWTKTQMYSEMGQARKCEPEKSLLRRLWSSPSMIWSVSMAISGVVLFLSTKRAPSDPVLKGPPQFILLAIIVALSAYLRAVRSSAVEQRDKIAGGEMWNYPLESPYSAFTERKLELLERVAKTLTVISPFFIILFMVITGRAAISAFDRSNDPCSHITRVLWVVDFIIVAWVFFAFVGLASSHFVARRRDDWIRAVAKDSEPEIIAKAKAEEMRERKVEATLVELARDVVALSKSEASEPGGPEATSKNQAPRKKYGFGTIAISLALIAARLLTGRK